MLSSRDPIVIWYFELGVMKMGDVRPRFFLLKMMMFWIVSKVTSTLYHGIGFWLWSFVSSGKVEGTGGMEIEECP